MHIKKIEFHNLRNLCKQSITLYPGINLLIGPNGSGKTSFLEAINIVSLGRSFRTHLIKRVISHGNDKLTIYLECGENNQFSAIGFEKNLSGDTRQKIDGNNAENQAQLAKLLPIQLINSSTFQLLTAGPKYRRQFIDWGLFHVEHSFFSTWKQYREVLAQRNAALRSKAAKSTIKIWDKQLIGIANAYDQYRKEYLEAYGEVVLQIFRTLMPSENIDLDYYPGWDQEKDYQAVLEDSFVRDHVQGYTQYGPHRGDFIITKDGVPVQDVFSRGQQKLLITSMSLAHGAVLQNKRSKSCIYMMDDLPSELDDCALNKIMEILVHLTQQIILTSIESKPFNEVFIKDAKMFHVEQGRIISGEVS